MINKLQKGLWILSSGIPILITFSIAWYINKCTYTVSLIYISIAIILLGTFLIMLKKIKTKLARIDIRPKKITQNDNRIIYYSLSYLLPFASIALDKYNPHLVLFFTVIIFMVLLKANTPNANPLLFILGYHFYDVETENGIGNYLVISKKSLRNKDELKQVVRITEYLLLDVLGEA